MSDGPEISVVIPVRNGATTIGHQLDALARQDFDGTWEVVVADNGSTDDLDAVIAQYVDRIPGLRIVRAGDRIGVPHARNCGVRAARADLIALCDADDEVSVGWLRAMRVALRTCDHVGGLIDEIELNEGAVEGWNRPHRRDGLQVALELYPYATGASCGVRREVFDAIGGWDEAYARSANDVEFSFRVQLAGYGLCWAPDAVVHYRRRSSLSAHALKSFRLGYSYPQIMRDFGRYGARDRDWHRRSRDWARIVALAPLALVDARRRGRWVGLGAVEIGRAWGLVRYRRTRRHVPQVARS